MIAGLKPYPTLKDSGVPWLGKIPEHWHIRRGKTLFVEDDLPVHDDDEIVTCFRDGQVTLRRNRRTKGFMIALKEVGYQGVREGQLVIHAMDAFAGAIGVSDSDGKCTPEYIVCSPRDENTSPRFFARALRLAAHARFIEAACPAVRERAPRLRYPNFGELLLPVPPCEEQSAISAYADFVDRRVQRLAQAKRKLVELLTERRRIATDQAMQLTANKTYRLEVVADLISRPIGGSPDEVCTPVGIYNRGRGIFKKESRRGNDLGDSDFFWIEEGDLIISGQFAWEGSIALAGSAEAGCVASHRYPILRGKPGVLETGFLMSLLQTDWGKLLLDHHSRGAAGRNRPLNIRTLLKEKISVPPVESQQRVVEMLKHESLAREEAKKWNQCLNEYRTRLISDVVAGKLDVREAAAALPEIDPLNADDGPDALDAGSETDLDELDAIPQEVEV